MNHVIALFGIVLTASLAAAEIKTETVTYTDGKTQCKGVLAYDDALQGSRPAILIAPEWWGLTQYPQDRARQLARPRFYRLRS